MSFISESSDLTFAFYYRQREENKEGEGGEEGEGEGGEREEGEEEEVRR